ncbi:MAG: hypothetical protein PHT48_12885 [Dechloromonas sp.]|nr:hypothetical protein [Dechloromonas sp.]
MKNANPARQRLVALGLLGIPLLSYPVLGLPQGDWLGLPAIFVYLFGVWGGLIAGAAWLAERQGR